MNRAIALAVALLCSGPLYAAAVTQTGTVVTPGGLALQVNPGSIFNQACNSGGGGIVGQVYGDGVCGVPFSPAAGAAPSASLFVESVTPLAGGASMPQTARDVGSVTPSNYSFFGCAFNADQVGTGYVEDSVDGTAWSQSATAALVAGARLDLNVRIRARYARCRYVNGATAQGTFRAVSSYTAN